MRTRVAPGSGGMLADEDGWHGARIGAETRDRARRAAFDVQGDIDIGEPGRPRVTIAFLALALLATIAEFAMFGASPSASELSRSGGAGIGVVATGAWWKLLVSNVLHGNIPHVLMNTFVIYLTGRWLEHFAGRTIMLATIGWSAIAAGIGSLLVDTPSVAIGASGVAFGIVGCGIAVDPRAKTAVGLISRQLGIVNVIVTFLLPGISIGGHLGGLAAGLVVGWVCWGRRATDQHPAGRARRGVAPALAVASLVPIALLASWSSPMPRTAAWLLERQLAGSTLTSGLEIDDAECEPGVDQLTFDCELDGTSATVRFSTRDDQWGLRTS